MMSLREGGIVMDYDLTGEIHSYTMKMQEDPTKS